MANVTEAPAPVFPETRTQTMEYVTGPSEGTVINGVAAPKKKRNRLNLDSLFVLILTVVIVFALMVTSFIASFTAIIDVAKYTGLPTDWLWVFPVFIDMAILAYTLSLFIFTHRGESRWRTLLGLFGFALLSIAANVAHTVSFWDGNVANYQAWIGIILTASAPVAVLLASEEIGRLAFSAEDE